MNISMNCEGVVELKNTDLREQIVSELLENGISVSDQSKAAVIELSCSNMPDDELLWNILDPYLDEFSSGSITFKSSGYEWKYDIRKDGQRNIWIYMVHPNIFASKDEIGLLKKIMLQYKNGHCSQEDAEIIMRWLCELKDQKF